MPDYPYDKFLEVEFLAQEMCTSLKVSNIYC